MKAEDEDDVMEDVLAAKLSFATAVAHYVPVSKKGCLQLVRALASTVQKRQLQSYITTRQLSAQEEKIRELELKVRLMTDDSDTVPQLNKTLAAGTQG